ncbi:FCD domain-containing protein [Devosia sp. A8/3-2]|nr:FCD domain-containing protein [Devosia sp. A8/3-2]
MKTHMDRVCNMTLQSQSRHGAPRAEHQEIMAAIDGHDVEGAQRAMAEHLGSILDDLPDLETRNASLFI